MHGMNNIKEFHVLQHKLKPLADEHFGVPNK